MTRRPAEPRASVATPLHPVPDHTDRVLHQWARVRPDLDVSSIGIISRGLKDRTVSVPLAMEGPGAPDGPAAAGFAAVADGPAADGPAARAGEHRV
jgi:hypothetical protein